MNLAWCASVSLQALLCLRLVAIRSRFRWFLLTLALSLVRSLALLSVRNSPLYGTLWMSTEWLRVLLLTVAAVEALGFLTRHHVRAGRLGGYVFAAGCAIAAVVCLFAVVAGREPTAQWSAEIGSVMPSLIGLLQVAVAASAVLLLVALLVYSLFAWQNPAVRSHAALLCALLLLEAGGYLAALLTAGQNLRQVNLAILISTSLLFGLWAMVAQPGEDLPGAPLSRAELESLDIRKKDLMGRLTEMVRSARR